jgi:hypothetical protein
VIAVESGMPRPNDMGGKCQDVFKEQRKLERDLPHDCEIAFLDRSGIDGIAYLRRGDLTPPEDLLLYDGRPHPRAGRGQP